MITQNIFFFCAEEKRKAKIFIVNKATNSRIDERVITT